MTLCGGARDEQEEDVSSLLDFYRKDPVCSNQNYTYYLTCPLHSVRKTDKIRPKHIFICKHS